MTLLLELRKARRTGFFLLFPAGALAALAFPLANTALRPERLLGRSGSPLALLLAENWSFMAMLDLLLVLAGSCALYHLEHENGCLERMRSLPVRESGLFFGKAALLLGAYALLLGMEAAGLLFCAWRWLPCPALPWREAAGCFGFTLLLSLPVLLLSLLLASVCRNMWVCLGIGVMGVFLASMLPEGSFALSLFPYVLPFRTLPGSAGAAGKYLSAAAVESIVWIGAELAWIKGRRWLT